MVEVVHHKSYTSSKRLNPETPIQAGQCREILEIHLNVAVFVDNQRITDHVQGVVSHSVPPMNLSRSFEHCLGVPNPLIVCLECAPHSIKAISLASVFLLERSTLHCRVSIALNEPEPPCLGSLCVDLKVSDIYPINTWDHFGPGKALSSNFSLLISHSNETFAIDLLELVFSLPQTSSCIAGNY
jgi:hypothetical protein